MKRLLTATGLSIVAALTLASCSKECEPAPNIGSSAQNGTANSSASKSKSGTVKEDVQFGQTININEELGEPADVDITLTQVEFSNECFGRSSGYEDVPAGSVYMRLTGDMNVKSVKNGQFFISDEEWTALTADNRVIPMVWPRECPVASKDESDTRWSTYVDEGTTRKNVSAWRLAERPAKLQLRHTPVNPGMYQTFVWTWELPQN